MIRILEYFLIIGIIVSLVAYSLPETFEKGLEEIGLKQRRDYSVTIPLENEGGIHYVVAEVCDIPMRFILDTGCSGIQVSPVEYNFLSKQGKLGKTDILSDSVTLINADGETSEGIAFVIPEITLGDTTLHEIRGVINSNLHAPTLLGQDVLEKLGTIQLDYKEGKLKVIR